MPSNTLETRLKRHLTERGLFDDQADQVLADFADRELCPQWEQRKHDAITDYPPMLTQVLLVSLNTCTRRWIDSNCPAHWARECFTP